MKDRIGTFAASRRDVMLGFGAASAALVIGSGAMAQGAAATAKADDLIKSLLKDKKPAEGKVKLEIPEIAENGNTVPFSVEVDSPMTAADHVKAIHVVAMENPQPEIGSYFFSDKSGKASAASRLRLSRTQDIVALAEMSDGSFYMTKRNVKVTIGGCGG